MKSELQAIDYNGGQIYGILPPNIKEGEEVFYKNGDSYHWAVYNKSYDKYDWCIKVIAQSPNLSLEGIPYVEIESNPLDRRVPTFNVMNYKADKIADSTIHVQLFEDEQDAKDWIGDKSHLGIEYGEWMVSSSAKKYTEEDVRKAIFKAAIYGFSFKKGTLTGLAMDLNEGVAYDITQSLQPKVVSIEVETTLKVKKVNYEK